MVIDSDFVEMEEELESEVDSILQESFKDTETQDTGGSAPLCQRRKKSS